MDNIYVHISRIPGSPHLWLALVAPAAGQINKDIDDTGALWAFSREYHLEGQPLGWPAEG